MCNRKLAIFIFALFIVTPAWAEPIGTVVFFYIEKKGGADPEVSSDFYHYYNKLKESFEKKGFYVLMKEQEPIKIKKPRYHIELSVKELGAEAGVLFVKPNGKYKVFRGVGTDIDVLISAEKYFNVKLLGK